MVTLGGDQGGAISGAINGSDAAEFAASGIDVVREQLDELMNDIADVINGNAGDGDLTTVVGGRELDASKVSEPSFQLLSANALNDATTEIGFLADTGMKPAQWSKIVSQKTG